MAALYDKDRRGRQVILLRDGTKVSINARKAPYRCDIVEDQAIQSAVRQATALHFQRGNPVARYDLKTKSTYWEYPDGTIRYAE